MTEITEVRRSRDWRTQAAVCWRWIFDEKILGKGDIVQLGDIAVAGLAVAGAVWRHSVRDAARRRSEGDGKP